MNSFPVIFLDRDGVLCKEKSYIKTIEELEIFSYSKRAVEKIHGKGYKVIVITNQSAVARGLLGEETLKDIHKYLKKETGVDAIYYCPHYPPQSQEEAETPYRINCTCRKPGIGLIEQAANEYPIDLTKAYFVGDRASDIQTGQAIGATTVLLESGYGRANLEAAVEPDLIFQDLIAFAEYIEEQEDEYVI